MARRCTVCTHPQRAEIESALAGRPVAEVAKLSSFMPAVTYQSLGRHKEHTPGAALPFRAPDSAPTEGRRPVDEMTRLISTALEVLTSTRQMLEGAEGRLDMSPRASEMLIVYESWSGGRKVRRKASLQDIVDAAERRLPEIELSKFQPRITDPRRTLLAAIREMRPLITELADLQEQAERLHAARLDEAFQSPLWLAFLGELFAELEQLPEVKERIVAVIRKAKGE